MREKSVLKEKSKRFGLRVIRLYKYLCNEKKEFVLSKQVLRSGTSIGANISESTMKIKQNYSLFTIRYSLYHGIA